MWLGVLKFVLIYPPESEENQIYNCLKALVKKENKIQGKGLALSIVF